MAQSFSEMLININIRDGATSSLDNINRQIKITENYLKNSSRIVRDNELSYEGLGKRITDTSKAMELNNQKIAQLTAKKLELEASNDTENNTYRNLVNNINTLVAKNSTYQTSIDSLTERKLNLANRTNELADSLRAIDLEMNRNVSNAQALGDGYAETEYRIEGTRQKMSAISVQMERQTSLISDLTREFGEHSRQVQIARDRYTELEISHNNLRNSLREMSNDTFNFRNVLMNTSQAVGQFADDFSNKTEFLGIVFKGAFIGAIASTITAVVPLLAQLGGLVIGGVSSIANSIAGIGLGAIVSKSLFSGVLGKSQEIDTLNEQIKSFKGTATGATSANNKLNKSLETTNKVQATGNSNLKEKERLQTRIKSLDEQINAIAEKERKESEKARFLESRSTFLENKRKQLLEIRDIESEINKLNKDRTLMEEQANQRILKSELALINQKISSSKYDSAQTQELVNKRDEILEAIKRSEKTENERTLAINEKKIDLEDKRKEKLKEIAKLQQSITKLDKDYANSNSDSDKSKLEKQRQALESQLSKLTSDFKSNPDFQLSMPSLDTSSLAGGGDNGLAELIRQRDELLNSLSPVQKQFLQALEDYKSWYGKFITQFEKPVFSIAITGLDSVKNVLEASIPIINGALSGVQKLGEQFNNFTGTSEFKTLMADLGASVEKDILGMGNALGDFGLGFMYFIKNSEPLKEEFLTFIQDMGEKFLNFAKNLDENESFKAFVKNIVDNKDDISELIGNLGDFAMSVLKFFNEYGEETIEVLNDLLPKVTDFVDSLTKGFSNLPEYAQNAIAKFTLFGGILSALGIAFVVLVKPVATLFGTLLKITGLGKLLKKALDFSKIPSLLEKIPKPSEILAKINVGEIGNKIGKGLKGIAKVGGKFLLPLQAVLSGIDFFKGFNEAKENFELEADEVPTIAQKISSGVGSVISGLSFGLLDSKKVTNWLYDTGTAIKDFFVDIGKWIGEKVMQLVGVVVTKFGEFKTKIGEFALNFKAKFDEVKIKATEIFNNIKEKVVVFVTNAVQKAIELKDNFVSNVNTIKSKFVEKFNSIKNKVTEVVTNAKNKAVELKDSFMEKVNSIKNYFTEKFNAIKEKVESVVTSMKDKISGFVSSGKEKINSFKESFSNGFNAIKEKASDIVNKIKGYFGSVTKKISDVATKTKEKIAGIFDTVKEKYTEMKDKVIKVFTDLGDDIWSFIADDVPKKLGELGTKFLDIGKELGRKFLDGFKEFGEKIKDISGYNYIKSKFANGSNGKLKKDTLALVNDGKGADYEELIIRPDGSAYIPKGRNVTTFLPKGSQVIKGSTTRKILDSFTRYANGSLTTKQNKDLDMILSLKDTTTKGKRALNTKETSNNNEIYKTLSSLNLSMNEIINLLVDIANKNTEIQLDGKTLGRLLDESKQRIDKRNKQARGLV